MSSPETMELCPLCCNELDATDRRFRPCRCGYQICAWCWHQLMELASKDDAKGRCPACRTEYDEDDITFDEVPEEELAAQKSKKKEGKAAASAASPGASAKVGAAAAARKHLQNVRVIQRNLVYVVGLSARCCKEEVLRKNDFFGKYGKILKLQVSVNRTGSSSYAGRDAENTGSAYVTFYEESDAMQCIQHIDGSPLDGRILRACFGTTKYCNAFLKYQPCNNPDCLYLHDIGKDNDSFTKEEMLAHYGTKHQSFQEATRVVSSSNASDSIGAALPRTSSLTAIPAPFTAGVRVPAPRNNMSPPPPAGPPPPNAVGVGVPVASAWPSLGSSSSKAATPLAPTPKPVPVVTTPVVAPSTTKSSIPAPRVPAPRSTGVCPVRPNGGWGQEANATLGVFGGPSSEANETATTVPSSAQVPKTKNGFTLPQPRKIVGAATLPRPKETGGDAAPAPTTAAPPQSTNVSTPVDAFPDNLFMDAFNSSLDFDPSAVLRRHTGASRPSPTIEQTRASRFGFALEAQSPMSNGAPGARDGESLLRALLPGASVRFSQQESLSETTNGTLSSPRRGPPPGFGPAKTF
ncbi:RNA recognition motif domain, eukaryote [Ostreococcus tauri]|uniref:RNA recognition motif domain, eukaryote n=1 Tax=Ostreococcus tauri TaxID=70448 RepID=A0A090N4E8_OSTTA|nr:RNA recognition motif domain, eukaryote [Ostreococcus tauri]CEF99743.1 RNA recognition motif domain, eukaryote [Ostreococcus tauri]|eukprot:XP_022840006.1 RNA recognition motif domain, eukaryote [Ostreococcus tauri]